MNLLQTDLTFIHTQELLQKGLWVGTQEKVWCTQECSNKTGTKYRK